MQINRLNFFYKKLVYKHPALGWQIAKQLSGLSPVSLSNNKNYRKRNIELFVCNKRKLVLKQTMHQNSVVSQSIIEKILKSQIINIDFESCKLLHSSKT